MYLSGVFSQAEATRRPVSFYINASSSFLPPPQAYPSDISSRPVNPPSKQLDDDNQISPSIVLIIIILTVIFFLSACLHVLIRYLAKAPNRDSNNAAGIGAGEGQLQQLFHLHDSGVEQAFIDALPVFLYKAVKGLKEGSDCPICLHEFQAEDKLRLLPKCSHAFHLDCIDTWLLTHSTCPLCRGSLLQYFSNLPPTGPGFTFESGDENRDSEAEEESHLQDQQLGINQVQLQEPQMPEESLYGSWPCNIQVQNKNESDESGKVMIMPIKLGKFRKIADCKRSETGNVAGSSRDVRRCYSMGSYEYAIDPSNLEVVITVAPRRRQTAVKLPLIPGHRHALSECIPGNAEMGHGQMTHSQDFISESRTLIKANQSHTWRDGDAFVDIDLESESDRTTEVNERKVEISNSKRWFKFMNTGGPQPGSVEKLGGSRRAFSFRLGLLDDFKPRQSGGNRRSLSETEVFAGWKDDVNLMGEAKANLNVSAPIPDIEDSITDYTTSNSEANASFGMRTINWLVGRQKRVVPPTASETWYVAEQK